MAQPQQQMVGNPLAHLGQMFQQAQSQLSQNLANGVRDLQQRFGKPQAQQQQGPAQVHLNRRRVVVPPRPAPIAAIIPGDSVGEAVLTTGLLNFLQLYNSAIVVRLVLTWFPNPPAFIEQPLATVTDPYLGLFRGIIPPLGGTLDLSPILAFVVLNFFTSSAAALPCDISTAQRSEQQQQQRGGNNPFAPFLQPSKTQQAYEKRVQAQRARRAAVAAHQEDEA